jgi:Tetracyclin repressor-like, C-terminal domain
LRENTNAQTSWAFSTRPRGFEPLKRGEVPADLDVKVAVDLIYGPLYHRLLHGHAPLTGRFGEAVVDMALTGIVNPSSQAGS